MEKHTHYPIKNGHVTWIGDVPPTEEQLNAFEKMGQAALAKHIKRQPEEPDMSWTDMECEECGETIEIEVYTSGNGRCESCQEKAFYEEFNKD